MNNKKKMKKKTKISQRPSSPPPAMSDLAQELIQETLLRLPIKSLLRFKTVSKPWLSLISSPHFAKLHLKIASEKPHKILLSSARHLRSLDFEASCVDTLALMDLHFPFKREDSYVKIVGSCNGLVCIALDYHKDFFIWNPSTGDYKKLPDPDMPANLYVYVYGFGYDLSSDDYKVVVAGCSRGASFDQMMFKVFKMRTNSWRSIQIQDPYCNVFYSESSQGYFSNGAVHWLATWANHLGKFKVIFAFDLAEEKFRVVQMPDFSDNLEVEDGTHFINLGIHGDCLCLSCNVDFCVEVWAMKEYGVKASWARLIILGSFPEIEFHLTPLCFRKSGHFISLNSWEELVWFNPEERTIKNFLVCEDWEPCEADVYVESLISPNALDQIQR